MGVQPQGWVVRLQYACEQSQCKTMKKDNKRNQPGLGQFTDGK